MSANKNHDWAKDINCKNVFIHGYCKFENKGCYFKHPSDDSIEKDKETKETKSSAPLSSGTEEGSSIRKKFSFEAPSFTPSGSVASLTNKFSTMSPKLDEIPTFVPTSQQTPKKPQQVSAESNDYFAPPNSMFTPPVPSDNSQPGLPLPAQFPQHGTPAPHNVVPEMFYAQATQYPLNYNLYAPSPPPHFNLHLNPNERTVSSFFIDDKLRESLQKRNEACLQTFSNPSIPDIVSVYHSLVPLNNNFDNNSARYGAVSHMYKATSNKDARLYALRRIENVNITDKQAFKTIKAWSSIENSNIVKVHEAFTTTVFGGNSLVVAYDFYGNAKTLIEIHFQNQPELITEQHLWSYLIQLVNALNEVHDKGLAVRSIDLSKVIVTNKNRIKLSGCGIVDILQHKNTEDIAQLQKKDLELLAKLLYDLSITSIYGSVSFDDKTQDQIIDHLKLSDDYKATLKYLISADFNLKEIQTRIAPRLLDVIDGLQNSNDFIESQLSTELENARLVRLMSKLSFLHGRPEHEGDPNWSESSANYPLTLFVDYVYHQVDERGYPVVDLAHVITCLNKLDAGIEERILLVSKDEKNCIIISYKELKTLIEEGFNELRMRKDI
ncbi:hypothetical protein LJB42_004466 [Komagataella kurtzmanii]|nr:hypothetical protein LJB42_004466 [Komagataella kurtzmanii]